MNNPDLSIIIVNFQTVKLIKFCIQNIKKLNLPFAYEIIVVDNHGSDGFLEMIDKNFLDVRYIRSIKNRGYAAGNNLGIINAKGKYLLIINPDVALLDDAILKMLRYMEQNPDVGIIGPKLLNADKTLQHSCGKFPDWRLPFFRRTFLSKTKTGKNWLNNYFIMDWDHNQNREVDWLFGACLMISKIALEKVGLLDERFFLYLEDTDWCRRFWENNYKVVYFADAKIIHYHQRSSAESIGLSGLFNKKGRVHLISFIKYYLKYLGKPNPHKTA